jgi:hypothetical protein
VKITASSLDVKSIASLASRRGKVVSAREANYRGSWNTAGEGEGSASWVAS